MKTLLVLARNSTLADAIRAVLDPGYYRVIHYQEVWAAEPLFSREIFDACFLDADLTDIRPLRLLDQLRRATPQCPVFIYASTRQWEWEEEAYLMGVEHILSKPVRARLLTALLERCWRKSDPNYPGPSPVCAETEPKPPAAAWGSARTLEVLRDFSSILTHSLQTESLLKQFLLLLREIISVNRAAIFLRDPAEVIGGPAGQPHRRRLHSACALGLPATLLEHFELSLDSGIGGYTHRQGRILKNGSEAARNNREIQKEFDVLGVQVAIPILDRESLIGVAVFDGRLTGEFFPNEELTLIFHLLEGLGLAIKNSWLHDELSLNHQVMADVLNQLGSGCVVVAQNLEVLHANQTARVYFHRGDETGAAFQFADLPPALASKVYEVLQTGTLAPSFKYKPPTAPNTTYRVLIAPFHQTHPQPPNAVMLLIEDFTQNERSQQLEVETAGLRLVKSMAEHLAHEIGNSLVPISTYQQLMEQKSGDPELHASIATEVAEGIRRISRLASQMQFLARDTYKRKETIPVNRLIEEAFQEALASHSTKTSRLNHEIENPSATISGDPAGLKHALFEVLLNALQSAPSAAPVEVRSVTETDRDGTRWLRIEVQDAGSGFSAETAQRATEPFYSDRTVGLGLGLTVTRKIIETHQGRLEIVPQQPDRPSVVRISLPMDGGAARELPEAGLTVT